MPTETRAAGVDVRVGYEDVTTYSDPTESKSNPKKYVGTVTYQSGTLTLNEVTVNGANGVESYVDLEVIIAGNNANIFNGTWLGIHTNDNNSLTLSGSGTLNITATNFGIFSNDDLTIDSGKINAIAHNNTPDGQGLGSKGKVIINGGSVSATGDQYGIYADTDKLIINGGSVIAEATNDDGKAFSSTPTINNGTWYKWRTSKDGDFTDSNVTPYTWSANDKYVEIQPLVSKTTTSSSSSGTGSTVTACDHDYEWVEDTAATADSDAKFVHKCKKCGNIDMRMTEANSAYVQFLRESADKITKAKANATVKIEAKNWSSFQRTIMDALSKRPDVTLVIEYTDAGVRRQITIPAGTDLTGFIDDNGYTGFDFLVSKGLETDYWAGRLNK